MEPETQLTLLGFLPTFLGLFFAWLFWGRKDSFSWLAYAVLLAGILANLTIFILVFGPRYLTYFIAGAIFGWVFEISSGLFFRFSLGTQLWRYHIFPIFGGYVTFFTPPFWGFATILFFRILETLGLV